MMMPIREKNVGMYKVKQSEHKTQKNIHSISIFTTANKEMLSSGAKAKTWCDQVYSSLNSSPAVERFLSSHKVSVGNTNPMNHFATKW